MSGIIIILCNQHLHVLLKNINVIEVIHDVVLPVTFSSLRYWHSNVRKLLPCRCALIYLQIQQDIILCSKYRFKKQYNLQILIIIIIIKSGLIINNILVTFILKYYFYRNSSFELSIEL